MQTILNLQKCTESAINNLPENMEIRGNLKFPENNRLISLPENLKVGGNLNLQSCFRLRYIPKDLKVGGMLNLFYTELKSLPEGLKIGGNLGLGGCSDIQSLPEGLKVGGFLDIRECGGLYRRYIPQDIQVGKEIKMSHWMTIKKEDFPERLWNQIKVEETY